MTHLPPKTTRLQGAQAEDLACKFLVEQGLRLIDRNFHCRGGEIDLIMRDTDNLVFVEVRYRRQQRYGSGVESVNRHKQRRIVQCATYYLHRHPRAAALAARFDVVALAPEDNELQIEWIRNAFDAI